MAAPPRPQLLFFGDVVGESAAAGDERMAVLRFEPVRITQVRIIPSGVKAFGNAELAQHVGQTAPAAFELDLYFHTLPPPRTPASVLPYHLAYDAKTAARRASQAFEPKLPADTRGRLLVISGRFERLTLAIYGVKGLPPAPAAPTPEPVEPAALPEPTLKPATVLPDPTSTALPTPQARAHPIPSFARSPPLPQRPAFTTGSAQRMAPSVSRERAEPQLPPLPDVASIVERQRKRPRLMVPDPTVDHDFELAIGVLGEGRGSRVEVARIIADYFAASTVNPTRSLAEVEASLAFAFSCVRHTG